MAGDVRQDEQFVILEIREIIGDALRRADIDLDPFLLQCEGELLRLLRIAVHEEHPRLAVRIDEALRGVVVEELVLEALDAGSELGHAFAGDLLPEAEAVFAGLDFDFLADDLVRAAEDFDFAFVVVVRIDDDFDIERLAFADLGRHVHARHLHFGVIADRQRPRENRHVAAEGRAHGIAESLVAIGEQHCQSERSTRLVALIRHLGEDFVADGVERAVADLESRDRQIRRLRADDDELHGGVFGELGEILHAAVRQDDDLRFPFGAVAFRREPPGNGDGVRQRGRAFGGGDAVHRFAERPLVPGEAADDSRLRAGTDDHHLVDVPQRFDDAFR